MEQILFIASMLSLGLSFSTFILGIFKFRLTDIFTSKYAKASLLFLLVYVVTFIPYVILSN
ncbi:hypothetical protein [Piscibacillus halophilus]|uniref:Uncharacterized protein n=1 Tax=Piscibacillus halophilus TaxID=571933 RepID=A0A1H9M6M9_9BACI|nr:hypothetical protein [Piscibacillus halophilus]SER19135.1 hypothetical protein SAMN05216362_1574 [Piscibacillus halophilus]